MATRAVFIDDAEDALAKGFESCCWRLAVDALWKVMLACCGCFGATHVGRSSQGKKISSPERLISSLELEDDI